MSLLRIIPLLFLNLLLGAVSGSAQSKNNESKTIIFVPGFRGSKLVDQNVNETYWLTAGEALWGNRTLELPLPFEKKPHIPTLHATEVLRSVPILPYLISIDIYGAALDQIGAEGYPIFEFAYDWRKDIPNNARLFGEFVRAVKSKGYSDITVLAHSMGGLVASYFYRFGAQELQDAQTNWEGASMINHLVVVAVPFQGSLIMTRDFKEGSTAGFNSEILSAKVLATFPSSYQLLPPSSSTTIVDVHGETIQNFTHDVLTWAEYKMGLFSNTDSTNALSEKVKFTSDNLRRSDQFYATLHAPILAPPHLSESRITNIIAHGSQTLSKAVVDIKEKQIYFERLDTVSDHLQSTLNEDGDGTVTLTSAKLPLSWAQLPNTTEIIVHSGHSTVLLERKVLQQIRD